MIKILGDKAKNLGKKSNTKMGKTSLFKKGKSWDKGLEIMYGQISLALMPTTCFDIVLAFGDSFETLINEQK